MVTSKRTIWAVGDKLADSQFCPLLFQSLERITCSSVQPPPQASSLLLHKSCFAHNWVLPPLHMSSPAEAADIVAPCCPLGSGVHKPISTLLVFSWGPWRHGLGAMLCLHLPQAASILLALHCSSYFCLCLLPLSFRPRNGCRLLQVYCKLAYPAYPRENCPFSSTLVCSPISFITVTICHPITEAIKYAFGPSSLSLLRPGAFII